MYVAQSAGTSTRWYQWRRPRFSFTVTNATNINRKRCQGHVRTAVYMECRQRAGITTDDYLLQCITSLHHILRISHMSTNASQTINNSLLHTKWHNFAVLHKNFCNSINAKKTSQAFRHALSNQTFQHFLKFLNAHCFSPILCFIQCFWIHISITKSHIILCFTKTATLIVTSPNAFHII